MTNQDFGNDIYFKYLRDYEAAEAAAEAELRAAEAELEALVKKY